MTAKGKLCVLTEDVNVTEEASKKLFLVGAKEELDIEEVRGKEGVLLICTEVTVVGVQIESEQISVLKITV